MESCTNFVVLVEIMLCIAVSGGASFESYPLQHRAIPSLEHYPGILHQTQDSHPECNYAYTEVRTPFYYYYVYAPAFKTSFLEDLVPTSYDGYSPYHKILMLPEGNFKIHGNLNPSSYPNFGVEYYSPKSNDLEYQNQEMSTHRPKFNSHDFLDRPYSTTFKTHQPDNSFRKPTSSITKSFLPTALLSSTPNILRTEGQGIVHDGVLRPDSYAHSFKHHAPNPAYETHNPTHKTVFNPSMFSSLGPNIRRDEVPLINKLFKPVITYNNNDLSYSTPNLDSPPYPPQSTPREGDSYHSLTSVFPSASLSSYSTNPPLVLGTSRPSEYSSLGETVSPLFTSSLEDYTNPTPVGGQSPLYQGTSTIAPTTPRHLFEAPGHMQPSRK